MSRAHFLGLCLYFLLHLLKGLRREDFAVLRQFFAKIITFVFTHTQNALKNYEEDIKGNLSGRAIHNSCVSEF